MANMTTYIATVFIVRADGQRLTPVVWKIDAEDAGHFQRLALATAQSSLGEGAAVEFGPIGVARA